MHRTVRVLVAEVSVAELKRLIAAKEKMVTLEARKAKLDGELAQVDAQLGRLSASIAPMVGRKSSREAGRVAAKKARRRVANKAPVRKQGRARRPLRRGSLSEVVATLIRKNGAPMPFQDIMSAITKRKLYKSRSKDFEKLLRKTVVPGAVFRRVGRGVYGVKG